MSGIAAAVAGVAAFGAVALPTFTALSAGLTALSTATSSYQAASQTLDIAIRKSPADFKAYQATIHGLEPDLQNAAKLLTNQNVIWQNLSPSMQKSVIALSNNSAALKLLLPDQRTALTALLAQRTAWDSLTPAQQKASVGLSALAGSYQKIVAALQPTVFKVFNDALKVANDLLPHLQPLAQAAGTAIDGLLKQFGKFTGSTGFKTWIAQFTTLAGPAITAIGKGVALVAVALGKLFTQFSGRDVGHAIAIVFDTIFGAVTALRYVIGFIQLAWAQATNAFVVSAPVILGSVNIILGSLKILADAALTAFTAPLKALSAIATFLHLPGAAALAGFVTNLGKVKTAADNAFTAAQNGIARAATAIKNAPLIAKLTANITGLQAKIAEAKTDLRDPKLTNPQKAKLDADISRLQAKVRAAQAAINGLKGKTVPITVAFNVTGNGSQFVGGTGFRLAGGGPAYGGIHLVGEQGPELVYTPPGSYVYNHAQTQQMMATGSPVAPGGVSNADIVNAIRGLAGILIRGNSITAGVGGDLAQTLNGAARSAAYRSLYNPRG